MDRDNRENRMDEELIDELSDGLEIRETVDGMPRGLTGNDNEAIRVAAGRINAGSRTNAGSDDGRPGDKPGRRSKTAKAGKRRSGKKVPEGRPDPYLWGIYIAFLVISVVELFSASSTEVTGANVYTPLIRHGVFLVTGFGIVLWLQKHHYAIISKYAWIFAAISLALLVASSFVGIEMNGAQRAIRFAGITIQPAEIVKLSVVCLLSYILGKNQTPGGVTNVGVITAAVVVVIFGGCLWRNGLTNTILLMAVSICMMMIGGIPMKKLAVVLGVYMICGGALYGIKYVTPSSTEFDEAKQSQQQLSQVGGGVVMGGSKKIDRTGTQIGRVKRFLKGVKPDDPIDDSNRQVIFSKFSQANGGLFGQGPGNSRESARLPLAFSDYIYSIIVEDTGFVGGSALLLLYLLLLARAGRIAYKCSRAFPAFLILGCAVMIVFQALVHMAIVTGVFPVSGQPLPFISKGGTSVIVMSAAMGIMMSVARYAAKSGDAKNTRAEKAVLPEEMQAANFTAAK